MDFSGGFSSSEVQNSKTPQTWKCEKYEHPGLGPGNTEKKMQKNNVMARKSGVPKPGCFNPGCCNFDVEVLFCALSRPFALFCVLLFAPFCAHLRSLARICAFLRLTAFRTTVFGNCRKKDLFKITKSVFFRFLGHYFAFLRTIAMLGLLCSVPGLQDRKAMWNYPYNKLQPTHIICQITSELLFGCRSTLKLSWFWHKQHGPLRATIRYDPERVIHDSLSVLPDPHTCKVIEVKRQYSPVLLKMDLCRRQLGQFLGNNLGCSKRWSL